MRKYLPVSPTFLRQTPQRFFFFLPSLSPSLSSCSLPEEVPAMSLFTFTSIEDFCGTQTNLPLDRRPFGLFERTLTSLIVSICGCCNVCIVGCAVLVTDTGELKFCGLETDTGVLLTGGCCFFLRESCRRAEMG